MSAQQHSFGGHALDRYLIDHETDIAGDTAAASAPTGDESVAAPPPADPPASGAADPGEATAGPPATPTPVDWNSPEARQAFEQWQAERDQAAQQAELEAAQQAQRQGRFSQIEDGLAMLGIDPAEFKDYMQSLVGPNLQPLAEAAQQYQAEQSVRQINEQLAQLGASHPGLLGDDVGKLADFKTDDGQPLFNVGDIKQQNQSAVVSATVGILEASKDATGQPTVPWTTALEHAAKTVQARDEIIKQIGREEFKRELAGVSAAATDITGGGTGGAARVTGVEGGDEIALARRWASENLGR